MNSNPLDDYNPDIPRHWSPESEAYAGADCLLTAIERGWRIVGTVYREDVLYRGARKSAVYHITLEYHQQRRVMPVISNPFLVRYLKRAALAVEKAQRPLLRVASWQDDDAARLA